MWNYKLSFSLFFISVPKVDADEDAYLGDCLSEWLRHAGAGNSQIRTLQESGGLVLSSMDEKVINRTSKNLLTLYLGFDVSLATNLKSCIGKIKELWETCGNLCCSKDQVHSVCNMSPQCCVSGTPLVLCPQGQQVLRTKLDFVVVGKRTHKHKVPRPTKNFTSTSLFRESFSVGNVSFVSDLLPEMMAE